MTDRDQGHAPFDELAAGHALHALEPADEQLFLEHAGGCAQCLDELAGFRDVAAALAEAAPAAEPSPQLGARIMAAALGDLPASSRSTGPAADLLRIGSAAGTVTTSGPGSADAENGTSAPTDPSTADQPHSGAPDASTGEPGTGTAGAAEAGTAGVVVPLHRRTMPRWLRPAAVAAAVALIAGGGVWAGLDATSSHSPSPVANCLHERGCAEVALTATGTHRQAAKVLVLDGAAWVMPVSMRADNTADQIYVLWQIIGKLPPRALGSFDVHSGSTTAVKIGKLAAPAHGTVFAVSLEHGRKIPPSPTLVVAAGPAS